MQIITEEQKASLNFKDGYKRTKSKFRLDLERLQVNQSGVFTESEYEKIERVYSTTHSIRLTTKGKRTFKVHKLADDSGVVVTRLT